MNQTPHSRVVWAVTPLSTAAGPAYAWVAVPTVQPTCSQCFLLSVMADLKKCQILNLTWRWTALPLCTERWHGEVTAAVGKVLFLLWVHRVPGDCKSSHVQGSWRQQGACSACCSDQEGPKNWEWKNESEWKQDHNFGTPKNCRGQKEDIETSPKVTKMWHVGTPQIPLVSPFYWISLFPNYKKAHDFQHYFYWSEY